MKTITLLVFCLSSIVSSAQLSPGERQSFKTPTGIIVCYANEKSMNTNIPEPTSLRGRTGGRVQSTATFEVTYTGFPPEAQAAFQKAVDIWSDLITSNVPIKINAVWDRLPFGTLGVCRPVTFEQNFQGAQRNNVSYPVALANKMANKDLKENESDIQASFNSTMDWHFDPNTPPTNSGKHDLVTVVLHEIGHGLGIVSAYEVAGSIGRIKSFFQNSPCIYDLYLQTKGGDLVIGNTSPSSPLQTALTGNSLFFESPSVLRLNTKSGKVYAPKDYFQGSSIAHNDQQSYPIGNPNSLMKPSIGADESIHDPGPITMGELNDMGWANPILTHTPLLSVERERATADFEVVCTLLSGAADYAPNLSTLSLKYRVNASAEVAVPMTATANANEYKAMIPKPTSSQTGTVNYAYYFSVNDLQNRSFSWPGKTVRVGSTTFAQTYHKFKVATNTQAPRAYHTPITRVRSIAPSLTLLAHFNDAYGGVQGGVVEWKFNENSQSNVNFIFVSDSTYRAVLPLAGLNLSQGGVIKYRITATNHAAAGSNSTSLPSASEYYTAAVAVYSPTRESYFNTFDNLRADDFIGDFTVAKPVGFNNGAIQSPHPYPAASQTKNFLDFTYDLLIPIKVKAGKGSIKFDEVVLVEPSAEDVVLGSQNFYDYVVVEGSADKGNTWKTVSNGTVANAWNSGEKADWSVAWINGLPPEANEQSSSNAAGDSSLYHRREISLLSAFKPEDEVILRFRLCSNRYAAGWGWAIDNLEIQVPDLLLHNHVDYVMDNTQSVELPIYILDPNALDEWAFVGGDNKPQKNIQIVDNKLRIDFSGNLQKGYFVPYRFIAKNKNGHTFSLPSTGYFKIYILDFKGTTYNFNSNANAKDNNNMFVGNFMQETRWIEKDEKGRRRQTVVVETEHPYLGGFGLNHESNFTAILTQPIRIDAENATFTFNENLALGDGDYATVEGSKDGVKWETLIDKYTTAAASSSRTGSFLTGNKFKGGEAVLLRFRLFSNKTSTGWGWRILNLTIQPGSTLTAIPVEQEFSLFPNPITHGEITLVVGEIKNDFSAQVSDIYGRQMMTQTFAGASKEIKLSVNNLSNGIYFVTLIEGEKRRTIRFVKL